MDIIWILGLLILILIFCYPRIEGYSQWDVDSYQGNPYDYYYPQYLLGYNLKSYFYRPLTTNHRCYLPAHLDRNCYQQLQNQGVEKAVAKHRCMQPAGITLDCLHQYYY
jgi:hypothetical protein